MNQTIISSGNKSIVKLDDFIIKGERENPYALAMG